MSPAQRRERLWIADRDFGLACTIFLLCRTKDPGAAADLRTKRLTEAACFYFWRLQQCIKNPRLG